jgi:hypothetical protein
MQLDFFREELQEDEHTEVHELHCRKCDQMKPLDNFFPAAVKYETEPREKGAASRTGGSRWCKDCSSTYYKGKAIANKQAGQRPTNPIPCECCGIITPPDKLNLDHDHITFDFRGWLCRSCNLGLGSLGDNIEGLEKAIAYLRKSNERT